MYFRAFAVYLWHKIIWVYLGFFKDFWVSFKNLSGNTVANDALLFSVRFSDALCIIINVSIATLTKEYIEPVNSHMGLSNCHPAD